VGCTSWLRLPGTSGAGRGLPPPPPLPPPPLPPRAAPLPHRPRGLPAAVEGDSGGASRRAAACGVGGRAGRRRQTAASLCVAPVRRSSLVRLPRPSRCPAAGHDSLVGDELELLSVDQRHRGHLGRLLQADRSHLSCKTKGSRSGSGRRGCQPLVCMAACKRGVLPQSFSPVREQRAGKVERRSTNRCRF
jgi:hypothetical protein